MHLVFVRPDHLLLYLHLPSGWFVTAVLWFDLSHLSFEGALNVASEQMFLFHHHNHHNILEFGFMCHTSFDDDIYAAYQRVFLYRKLISWYSDQTQQILIWDYKVVEQIHWALDTCWAFSFLNNFCHPHQQSSVAELPRYQWSLQEWVTAFFLAGVPHGLFEFFFFFETSWIPVSFVSFTDYCLSAKRIMAWARLFFPMKTFETQLEEKLFQAADVSCDL